MRMPHTLIKKILQARVYDVAIETPVDEMPRLSRSLNNTILLKREDLQPVFSFKLRGAYNKIANLPEDQRRKGVIAASAGNHAQGVALAAQRHGVECLIVMPKTTPTIKVNAVRSLGAKTVLHGDTYDDACRHATSIAEERGMIFVHPYDDPDVVAGQGTIAMEILHQCTYPIHAIFVPVGGGGLIAGMAAYIKYLRPEIRVIGVEPEDAPSMHAALEKGRRITLKQVGIFADGVAVRQVGKLTYQIARKWVDEVVLVNSDEICGAILDIFDDTRSIAEPAGALAIAGLKKYVERNKLVQQVLVAVDSGANINFDKLRYVTERAELGEKREALFAVTIPEEPGSFRRFCHSIGHRSITEFNYRYSDPSKANVFVGVQLVEGDAEKKHILDHLRELGYPVVDMTDNEMAKMHIRYMVGGHAASSDNEYIYRFEFPERPGALLHFLKRLGQRWNISLFHYRNHGAAYGRVLVGIQVPQKQQSMFVAFIDSVGYAYWNESDNPAYRQFLGRIDR